MEQIDVHGLPEEEMQLIAAFVEFLLPADRSIGNRQRLRQPSRNLSLLHGPSV